jgi:SAM-dependent methyltransferase
MAAPEPLGTSGYAEAAPALLRTVLPFEAVHEPILHFMPSPPARILDVGAGPGHDAAAFARLGHRVTAVEPTAALREGAQRLYADLPIRWLADSLPGLAPLEAGDAASFDFILLSGVWMHLDEAERRAAFPRLAGLLAPGGVLAISLRHGWVPPGRVMYEVTADKTLALAAQSGLTPVLNLTTGSLQPVNRAAGVTWTRLAFVCRS